MTQGQQSVLGGIAGLMDQLSQQTQGIVQFRAEVASRRGMAEIDLMNARFIGRIQAGEISPETFQEAFQEQQEAVKGFIDEFDFPLAREMMGAAASEGFASLYAQSFSFINKQQLELAAADYMAEGEAIRTNPAFSREERYAKTQEWLERGKGYGFTDKLKLTEARFSADRDFRIGTVLDAASALGPRAGYEFVLDDDAMTVRGFALPDDERAEVIRAMGADYKAASSAALGDVTNLVTESTGRFIGQEDLLSLPSLANLSDDDKVTAMSAVSKHNNAVMVELYDDQITDSYYNAGKLQAIKKNLVAEVDDWVGTDQEKERLRLIKRIDDRIKDLETAASGGSSGSGADIRVRIALAAEAFKRGVPFEGKPMTAGVLRGLVDSYVVLGGDTAVAEYKNALSMFQPGWLNGYEDRVERRVKLFDKKTDPAIISDYWEKAHDEILKNPSMTGEQVDKMLDGLYAVATAKTYDVLRGKVMDDAFGKEKLFASIGGIIDEGKTDYAMSVDPLTGNVEYAPGMRDRLEATIEWRAQKAASILGEGVSADTDWETGKQIFRKGALRYTFKGNDLYILGDDGKLGKKYDPKGESKGAGLGTLPGTIAAGITNATESLKAELAKARTSAEKQDILKAYWEAGDVPWPTIQALGYTGPKE